MNPQWQQAMDAVDMERVVAEVDQHYLNLFKTPHNRDLMGHESSEETLLSTT